MRRDRALDQLRGGLEAALAGFQLRLEHGRFDIAGRGRERGIQALVRRWQVAACGIEFGLQRQRPDVRRGVGQDLVQCRTRRRDVARGQIRPRQQRTQLRARFRGRECLVLELGDHLGGLVLLQHRLRQQHLDLVTWILQLDCLAQFDFRGAGIATFNERLAEQEPRLGVVRRGLERCLELNDAGVVVGLGEVGLRGRNERCGVVPVATVQDQRDGHGRRGD